MIKLNLDERMLIESGINHYRLVGPGLIWLKPWQRVVTTLYVGPRDQALQVEEVRTVENIPVTITVQLLYQIARTLITNELIPWLPRLNDGLWQQILKWRVEYVVRQMVADYPWRELSREKVQSRLERQLTQTLADHLSVVGLKLTSLSLVKIELPGTLQQTIIQVERDSIEPRGRALVLKEYFDIFGHNLTQAMPYIVQWELLNTLRKKGDLQILLTNSALSLDKRFPGNDPLLQLQLPLPQNN